MNIQIWQALLEEASKSLAAEFHTTLSDEFLHILLDLFSLSEWRFDSNSSMFLVDLLHIVRVKE